MLKTLNKYIAVVVKNSYVIAKFFDTSLQKDFQIIKSSIFSREIKNPELIRVILLAEDKRFFEHRGIDIRAILRAGYRNLFCNRLEGGSTIEQQYVRLITNRRDISFIRKVRECILATKISGTFPKSRILSSYLLKYKFVGNIEGVEEFAQRNNFDLALANVEELSVLAARLKYPFVLSDSPLLTKRVAMILRLYTMTPVPQQTKRRFAKIALQGLTSKA